MKKLVGLMVIAVQLLWISASGFAGDWDKRDERFSRYAKLADEGSWEKLLDLMEGYSHVPSDLVDVLIDKPERLASVPEDFFPRLMRIRPYSASAAVVRIFRIPEGLRYRETLLKLLAGPGSSSLAKSLAKDMPTRPFLYGDAEIVHAVIAHGGPEAWKQLAKYVLPLDDLVAQHELHLGMLWQLVAVADANTLRKLSRYTFPKVPTSDLRMEILRAAIRLSESRARNDLLSQAAQAYTEGRLADLQALLQGASEWAIPAGYESIKPYIGSGKNGRVALVKRVSDGVLFAWKVPVNDAAEHREAFEREVEAARSWKAFGLSKVDVFWAPDGKTLLKTFVNGPTLKKVLLEEHLMDHPEDERHQALRRFVLKAIRSRHYVSGLNAENLMYEAGDWHIIDSAQVTTVPDLKRSLREHQDKLQEKWTRMDLLPLAEKVRTFLKSLKQDLHEEVQAESSDLDSEELETRIRDLKAKPPLGKASVKRGKAPWTYAAEVRDWLRDTTGGSDRKVIETLNDPEQNRRIIGSLKGERRLDEFVERHWDELGDRFRARYLVALEDLAQAHERSKSYLGFYCGDLLE